MADFVAFLRRNVLGEKDVDFMGLRYICYAVSLILILVGLTATFIRGSQILDIDFNGGTSVTFALDKGLPPDEVRQAIGQIFDVDENGLPIQTSLTNVTMEKFPENSVYKLDTSLFRRQASFGSIGQGVHAGKDGSWLDQLQR